jgi:hypothetical protein
VFYLAKEYDMVAVAPMGMPQPEPQRIVTPPPRQEPPPSAREGEAPAQQSEPYGSAFAAAYAASAAKIDAVKIASQKWMFGLSVGLRRAYSPGFALPTAPTALDVHITGTPTTGSVLTGVYTFDDLDGDPEGVSTFAWLRDGVAIAGATAKTYTLVVADENHNIAFKVTPVSTVAPTTGAPVTSAAVHATPVPP